MVIVKGNNTRRGMLPMLYSADTTLLLLHVGRGANPAREALQKDP